MMAKFVPLNDQEWVLKAASRDKARPVLTAVNVDDFAIVATDGHRLHLAVRSGLDTMQKGVWEPKRPGMQMSGTYPNYWGVLDDVKVGERINQLNHAAIPVLKAAATYSKERGSATSLVSMPTTATQLDGHGQPMPTYVRVNATYLLDVLAGRNLGDPVLYVAPSPTSPVLFLVRSYGYIALVMPIRGPDDGTTTPETRFDLSEFASVWVNGDLPESSLPGGEKATPGGSSGKKKIRRKSNAS